MPKIGYNMFTVCSGLEWLCVQFAQVQLVTMVVQHRRRKMF